jgi:predicted DNA-binding transcriptional regulator AlpA
MKSLMTRQDVADYLGIAVRTVSNKVLLKEFPPPDIVINRKMTRWYESTVVAYVDKFRVAS